PFGVLLTVARWRGGGVVTMRDICGHGEDRKGTKKGRRVLNRRQRRERRQQMGLKAFSAPSELLTIRHHRLRTSERRVKSKRTRGVRVHGVVSGVRHK